MEKLTPEQLQNWRKIMSSMGMSLISSMVSDKEVENFANGIQRRIEMEERSIEESNKARIETVQVNGFKNTIRVVKGK